MKRILYFSGSNSSKSINQALACHAASFLQSSEGHEVSLRDFSTPLYCMDLEEEKGIPEQATRFLNMLQDYDGYIISTPEHNGMIPAVFKNLLDWLSRTKVKFFGNKPILVMSASPGRRAGLKAREHLEHILPWWAGNVVATYSIGSYYEAMDLETQRLKTKEEEAKLMDAVQVFEKSL